MFDRVITNPDWRAALHGQPVMSVTYDREVFTVCTAKAIHTVREFTGRGNNPFNLALMIKHHVSWDTWKDLPWFAVCDSEERELFCIQSPFSDNAVSRMMLESRVLWVLKIRKEGVVSWLRANGADPDLINDYVLRICREFDELNDETN
jgi:hypothetical protein